MFYFEGGERMQNERERQVEEIVRILRGADARQLKMVWWFVQGMNRNGGKNA